MLLKNYILLLSNIITSCYCFLVQKICRSKYLIALTEYYNISKIASVLSFVSYRNVGAPPNSRPGL